MSDIDIRSKSDIQILQQHQSLPPIEWHLNNLTQLGTHLMRLRAPDIILVIETINALCADYQRFLNSYEKADKAEVLINMHTGAHALAGLISTIDLTNFARECSSTWTLWQTATKNPKEFAAYVNEATGYLIAIHDFALGLGATCTITSAEPEKHLYKHLEEQ